MTDREPKIIRSPLSRKYESGGVIVNVEIYKLEGSQGWTLELVDPDWNSIVWEELFVTDQAALDEFMLGVQELGLARLLEPEDDDPPFVTIH